MSITATRVTLVGGGLVGALEASYLARRGFEVEVLERRPDMRREPVGAGRSINLAISRRGLYALERLGLDREILRQAVPMKGRMVHALDGGTTFQPYGKNDSECINSLSRGALNGALMTFAERTGGVRFHFNTRVTGVDLEQRMLRIEDSAAGTEREHLYDVVLGTDGSASAVRDAMLSLPGYHCTEQALDYGYKELTILPRSDGGFALEPNALHIWPRGTFMLIALPNAEGSFTCTLFLPYEGAVSFEALATVGGVERFFDEQFPDAAALVHDLTRTFFSNPTGRMVTIRMNRWHVGGDILLMGDAAHAIVPFFGQGMNCGFEDCVVLDDLLGRSASSESPDWSSLFDAFAARRMPDTGAIADMAVENFLEMRDKVADPRFLLRKAVERILEAKFPGRYVSRYSLVSFSTRPYRFAYDVGVIQTAVLDELCEGIELPEQVDLARAGALIDERLAPMFRPGAGSGASGGAR